MRAHVEKWTSWSGTSNKEVHDPLHYPSVVYIVQINTIASKGSKENYQQIGFGQSQDPCTATLPVRCAVISVVLICLITFQDPTTRASVTL